MMNPLAPGAMPAQATFTPQHTQGHVLCCLCGVPIAANPANMCVNCIRSQVDITAGVQKQLSILWCKECNRYLNPPKNWTRAELESKELLTFCVKRIKGLQKVKLVDAGFIWTEPHSRRLKVKLTVQAEVFNGAILQQAFVVDFTVEPHMCPDCARTAANPNSWVACAQVRQHAEHKRTFFYLEQLILKHNADAHSLSIRDVHEGVDFYYGNRAHALKLIDFLQQVVPIRFRADKQLVSHDTHSNTYNYKYTFSVEIVPVCKDDLVCLPGKLASSLGNLGPVVLVTRVTNAITVTDVTNLRSAQIEANVFWRYPFRPMLSSRQLTEYVVLDIEPVPGTRNSRYQLAEAQVARAADLGANDTVFFVRTHLGNVLRPGDTVMGYDVANANLNDAEVERKGLQLPDVVLVRKSYEEKRRRRQARGEKRSWTLRRLNMETDEPAAPVGRRGGGEDRQARELERFYQELEEDPDLRAKVALYRDPNYDPAAAAAARAGVMTDDEEGDDLPEVPLEELLDGMNALAIDADEEEDEEEGGMEHE